MLTDSYFKLEQDHIMLSGKCSGVTGLATEVISQLNGGDADVTFIPVDDNAKRLVKDRLNVDYVDNDEGYIIKIDDSITVYANSDRAKLYAAYSIKDKYKGKISKGVYYSYPSVPHRSVRLYLPFKKNFEFFKKYIDSLVSLGYNTLLLELGGAMEYKRHPEINETWSRYCESMAEFNGKCFVAENAYYRTKTSIHTFNGGGDIYSHEEMREIIQYCKERYIDIIPEVPSLSHSDYFLISHPELRECDDEPFASTACPSNPDLYKLVYDLYDEVIDLFNPEYLHIGHDEWWVMCVCERCKGKNPAHLYADNVIKCYEYLKKRGVKTMMWGDKLARFYTQNGEVHGGAAKEVYNLKTDRTVNIMGTEYPVYERYWFDAPEEAVKNGYHQFIQDTTECADMLPDDIVYLNWYYPNEPKILDSFISTNKKMIYGNCSPVSLTCYKDRFKAGALGFSVSSWYNTSSNGLQFWQTTFDLGYGSIIAWNHNREETDHEKNLFETFDYLFNLYNDETLNKPHIEVTHAVTRKWEDGEKFFAIPYNSYINLTPLLIGNYEVKYKDGKKELFPVYYAQNIGIVSSKTERAMNPSDWSYLFDPRLAKTAPICNIEKNDDGIFYKTLFPISGKVESCEFIPCKGLEDLVIIKNINIF